jgi:hypothetical protein
LNYNKEIFTELKFMLFSLRKREFEGIFANTLDIISNWEVGYSENSLDRSNSSSVDKKHRAAEDIHAR